MYILNLLNSIYYFFEVFANFYDSFFSFFFFINFVIFLFNVFLYTTPNTLKKCLYLYVLLFIVVYLLFLLEIHMYFGFLVFTETTLIFFLCNLCIANFNFFLKNKKNILFFIIEFIFVVFFLEKNNLNVCEYFFDYISALKDSNLNDFSSIFFIFEFNFFFIIMLLHILFVVFLLLYWNNPIKKLKTTTKDVLILKYFNMIYTTIFKPSIKKFK